MSRASWRFAFAALAAAVALAPPAAAAQVRGWPSESPPKPLPERPAGFPPYALRTLPNGLQVVAVTDREQPIVSAQMLVKAGAASDPKDKPGVANLVAQLLDQGTPTRTAGEIADAVDSAGAELTVLSGTDVTFAQVTVMSDGVGFGLDTLSDVIRHPAFAAEELERQRQRVKSGLQVNYEDPAYIADVVFDRLVFGGHPYVMPGAGTPDSIGRITRDDLVEFHRQYFAPNHCILAIVGDIAAADAFAAAEKAFGGWERRDVARPALPDPPPPARRVVVIDRPGSVQTEIRVGHFGIPRKSKDFLPVDLGVRILGGEGANRLQQVLRISRGLTYGASADLDAFLTSGVVRAETNTRSIATAEVLRLMVDEFFKVQREVVEEQELDDVKAYVTGSYPLGLETPGSISTKVLNALFHELPLKELETHRERVTALTPDDIHRAMRTHLRPDRLSVVLVGNAAVFVPMLRGAGFREVEVIPLAALDVAAPDLRRPAAGGQLGAAAPLPAGVPVLATRETWGEARGIVMRAIRAAGGEAALRAVKTLTADADTVLLLPAGALRATTRTFVKYPDRFRVDAKTPQGEVVQAYAAGPAWLWDVRGSRDAPAELQREFALSVRRDWIALLLAAADNRVTGRRLDAETGPGGRVLDVVEVWSTDLPSVKIAVGSESGRIERLTYQSPGPRGPETVTESFDDFRFVDGVLYPFRAITRRENAPMLERSITSLTINALLEDGLFEKPR